MTEDFEDIYKEKETIPEDVVKWNDGSLFSFINTSEFKGNPLKQKVKIIMQDDRNKLKTVYTGRLKLQKWNPLIV